MLGSSWWNILNTVQSKKKILNLLMLQGFQGDSAKNRFFPLTFLFIVIMLIDFSGSPES